MHAKPVNVHATVQIRLHWYLPWGQVTVLDHSWVAMVRDVEDAREE